MTLGERIREEREAQGISRVDLAKHAGIAVSTLSDLELGLSKGTTVLHKIAFKLGVSSHWLETGKGKKEPQLVDPSQSVGLDVTKLTDLIETLEAAAVQAGRDIPPRTKARVLASLYASNASREAVVAALASIFALED